MGSPQKNGAYCHTQPSPPPSSKIEHEDLPYLFTPPQLWLIDNYITNYVVWRTHVHDQFRRDGLLGFIDGTMIPPPKTVLRNLDDDGEGVLMENQDYHRWREEFDKPVKERLLSLLDKDVVPVDHQHKTCTDIWMDLRERFQPLVSRLEEEGLEGVYQPGKSSVLPNFLSTSGEYIKLHTAAMFGDKWAAKHILQNDVGEMIRNCIIAQPLRVEMRNDDNYNPVLPVHDLGGTLFPQHTASLYSQEDMLSHLFFLCRGRTPYADTAGLALLISAIDAGHFSLALKYLSAAPQLAGLKVSNKSALTCLASNQVMFGHQNTKNMEYVFPRAVPFYGVESVLGFMLESADNCIPRCSDGRLDFLRDCSLLCIIGLITFISCCIPLIIINILYWPPWKFLQILGYVEKKPKNQARDDYDIQLIDSLCDSMKTLPGAPKEIFGEAFLVAARIGAHVVVERILAYFPEAAFLWDPISSQYVIHMAVESRDQDMFVILYKELRGDNFMRLPLHISDSHGNNILHLAAKLSPQLVLDKIPGPVLQIQHELKWFKEIEKIIRPHYQVRLNHDGKTPQMIFTEEHKELKDKADKWIKDTSTPCTIIAALISIIMFATALTIPGGSDQHAGFPIITRNAIFTLFVVSDAISFITSVISLLMFMDIMMSHYKVGDFMRHLPIRLFIGLGSLFVAIFFMMLSFSAVVYLVFGQQRRWVLILVVTVTSYVVLLFGYLQGSVLLEMIIGSTYNGDFIPDPQRNNLPRQNHQDNPSVDPLDIL